MAMEGKEVTLKSSDGEEFVLEEVVAEKSVTIKYMIEDGCADGKIPVPNVKGTILAKVIEYCKKHVTMQKEMDVEGKKAAAEEALKVWDAEFIDVDQALLYEVFLAANYLNILSLVNLACDKVVSMIKGKSPEEIRKILNIENDLTPEEDAEIRKAHPWAFE